MGANYTSKLSELLRVSDVRLRLAEARWGFSDGLTVVGEYPTRVYVDKQGKVIAAYEVGSEF